VQSCCFFKKKNVGLEEKSYVLIDRIINTLFNLTTDKLILLLTYFFVVMSLLLIMSLYALVKAFVEKNLRFLAIHLLCGAGSFDLYKIKNNIAKVYNHCRNFIGIVFNYFRDRI